MDEEKLFFDVIKQEHILGRIMDSLSLRDSYNFSITCRNALESTKCIKKKGSIRFDDEGYKVNLFIRSPNDINVSRIEYIEFRSNLSCPVSRLDVTIDFNEEEPTQDIMKGIGEKLNELLMVNQTIQKLNLHFEINFSCDYHIGNLINEIMSDNFSRLEISIFISSWVDMGKFNIPSISDKIFDGFKNLKEIEMEMESSNSNGIFNKLVDAAANIKGAIIETSLKHDKQLELPYYILDKHVFLSIVKSEYDLSDLNLWFSNLDVSQFSWIQKLCINVRSLIDLRKFSNYLSHMTNLEWLRVVFYIDEIKFEENNNEELGLYTSSKHLTKLRTMKVEFYNNVSLYNEDNIIKNGGSFEALSKPRIMENEKMGESKIFYTTEMLNFLSTIPSCLEGLYFYKVPLLTCKMTTLLNFYFPNLVFLYLDMIPITEQECLRNLKNLKYYVSRLVNGLELQRSIRASMVKPGSNWCSKVDSRQIVDRCCEYYRDSGIFTKEFAVDGSIKGRIFLNYFHDLFSFKSYIDSVH
uniref:F-box domain-containing protein n=1 Tax=Strongyloides papillosus TaxID=174720 RepID=A0A0N5B8T6_STREA